MGQKRFIKILLIDDTELLREMAADVLQKQFSANIVQASGGKAALQIVQETNDLTLVICDYAMPNGNGFWVYNELQRLGCNVPFILYTSMPNLDQTEFKDIQVTIVSKSIPELVQAVSAKLALAV